MPPADARASSSKTSRASADQVPAAPRRRAGARWSSRQPAQQRRGRQSAHDKPDSAEDSEHGPRTARLRFNTNLNWELPWHKPLTLTSQIITFTRWAANSANTLYVPGRTVVHMGARYKFNLAGAQWLARAKVENIFNVYGWTANGSGFLTANPPRRYSLSLAVDL